LYRPAMQSALQYLWTFTNGNPGTAITPVPGAIAYSQLGTHPITLTVTSECGATTGNGSVDIIAPPIAAAGSDKTICSDGTTSIGSGGSPGITYQWTPITGISSPASAVTDISLQYTGANADTTLTYVLKASAGVDCFSTDTVLITIQKRPTIIAKTADNTICEGSSTQLTVLGASSYLWSPAGSLNSNTGDTVLASPPASTIYAVIGTAANGCTDTTTVTVNIQAYPATDAGADSTVCNNTTSVQLVGFPAGGTWSGSNITSAGLFNPQAAGNGVYTLKYTAALNQCSKQDSTVITVIDPPVANAGADTTVCQNSTPIAFTGLPAGGTWSGNAFITPNGSFTPTTAGNYQLIYTFGGGSCISKDTITVLVKDAISNNSISPSQSVCINTQPAIINGLVATGGDGTPAYQWQQSTDSTNWVDIASATSVNYTPPVLVSTTWYRRLAFTTLCAGTQGSISNPVKITVRENSIAEFTAGKTLSCIPFDLSTVINTVTYPDRNGTYQWFANDVLIGSNSTGVFPGYTISTQADSVTIKLITLSQYGCKPDTQTIQFFTAATSFAGFAKDTAGGCGPLTVNFTNTSSIINNNIQFFWDFGNGQLSNLAQPLPVVFNTSAYFNDTTYYITLKTYNGCDTTIWKDSVKVRSNPNARFGLLSTEGCSPFTVNINNTSLGGPNTYYWDFGNGDKDTTYTTGLVTYTYNIGNNPDTVTITLIALNECGSDTSQIDVRIAPNVIRPQVNINSSQLFGCSPHTVGFINSTSGATRYVWNFGDGAAPVITNNSQNVVTHTYTDTGTFNIRIDMSNGCSDTSVFRQVTVYPSPVANFSTSAAIYCLGDTITVNNSSSNATNYRWFWGDGQTSVSANPVHLYATAGNYTVYLRAERSNSNGLVCYDTLVRPITVLVRPNVSIQSNIAPVNCAPFTLALAAPGIINETATWLIYDSTATPAIITITGATAQYTFNKPGTFSAKLIASNTLGCTDSATVTFTVKGTPQASFTPGNFSICTTDTTIAYTNTSTYNDIGPLSYRWIVDNLQRSVNGNFTHRYTAPAGAILPLTFTTQLIVSNTVGCSDTASAILQMSPSATAAFSISNANACVPFNLAITDASRFATRYRWFVNNVLADTTANPTIIITQPATAYSIRLIADNIYGCTPDTVDVNFTTRSKPAARFTLNDTLGCNGVLNTVTNNRSTNANAYTWDWGDNSPRNNFVNPTHLYGTQGQYLITLIATDGTCSDTSSQLIRVSLKPTVDFSADNTLTCDTARVKFSNLTQNASNYTWYFSDGGSSTSAEPFHAFAPSITPYTVKLVADNGLGCKDSLTKPNLITAKVPPPGDFFISPNATISYPNYTFSFNNLTPASNNYTYQWNLGDGTFASTRDVINHKYGDTGNYAVQLVVLDAASQCLDTTTRIARIDGFPGYLYVPNAICPNCMQSNVREFMPKGKGLAQYRLQILTTWGELIFETTSLDADGAPNKAWDGRVKGQLVQQDVYVWRIDAKFKNGTEWLGMIYPGDSKYKKAGTITVVK
jgi:PKD repeat protein